MISMDGWNDTDGDNFFTKSYIAAYNQENKNERKIWDKYTGHM